MNIKSIFPRKTLLKLSVVATALVLPGLATAGDAYSGVTTRADTSLEQHNGRDSVYALSPDPVYSTAQVEPQRYGRGGGYVGTDRVEMSKSLSAGSARVPTLQAAQTSQAPQASQAAQQGRTAGGRFDNPDSAHGQDEGTQVR